jgi:hypothetical protein
MDIVICVGPNDISVIQRQIEFTKKNVVGYRKIFLVASDSRLNVDGCITIDEGIFPFSMNTVSEFHGKRSRNGWYLQQLLKLYAGFVVPDISEKYLVIDADTFFLKPTTFLDGDVCLYNVGTEYHAPYFAHMSKLHPDLKKYTTSSGICHHMMFETKYVKHLFEIVESLNSDEFYKVFLKCVTEYTGSGASEYEIYFNFMLKFHSDKIKIRSLSFKNTNRLELDSGFDYISYHWYMR